MADHSTPNQASAPASCRIEGPLVISTVADWHRRLVAHVTSAEVVALDLGGLTAIDVFGLQLLCAAGRAATAQGRTFSLLSAPPLFAEACDAAGFNPTAISHSLS